MNISEVKQYLSLSPYYGRVNWGQVDLSMLIEKTLEEMPDEYNRSLFYDRLANRSGSFSNICTEYDNLASLILSRLHDEETSFSFVDVVLKLQENKDVMGRDRPILSPDFVEFILENREKVESIYQKYYKDCFLPSMFGWKTLMRSYFLKSNGKVVERFPHMLFRVALFIHGKDWEKTITCYRDLLDGKYTHATPTLFHAGTRRSQMASCFLPDTPIWTTKGIKPISRVEIGDMVFTHTGSTKRVLQIHENPRNYRKLFRLFSVYKEVATATENHEFMVFDTKQGKIGWKALGKLNSYDYIMQGYNKPRMFPTQTEKENFPPLFWDFIYQFPRMIGNILGKIYQTNEPVGSEIDIPFYSERMCSKTYQSLSEKSIASRLENKTLILTEPVIVQYFQNNRLDILKYVIQNGSIEVFQGLLDVMKFRKWETTSSEEAGLLNIFLNQYSSEDWAQNGHVLTPCEPKTTFMSPCIGTPPPSIMIDGKRFVRFLKRVRSRKDENQHSVVYTLGVDSDHSYCVNGIIAKNCFLLGTEDSVEGIFKTISDCAQISKWAGGIGVHLSNIRANKSYIYGTNGNSNGILPMLKVYNDVSRYIDQCFQPDVLLFTKKGMRPIGTIQEGDMVLSALGHFQPVKKVVIHSWNGSILNINGWGVTSEHNFLIHSGENQPLDYKSLDETSNQESIVFPKVSFYDQATDNRMSLKHIQMFINFLKRWKKDKDENHIYLQTQPFDEELVTLFLSEFYHGVEWEKMEDGKYKLDKHAVDYWFQNFLFEMKKVSIEKQKLFIRNLQEVDTKSMIETIEMLKVITGWDCVEQPKVFTKGIHSLSIQETQYEGPVYDLEMEGDPSYVTVVGTVHNGGGKRNGAFAMYIEPWHADIYEFVTAKRNIGAEDERARDLFYGLWIPDLFMERVEKNQEWSLFCPSIAPGLADVIGEDFKRLYEQYEREGRSCKKIQARELWSEILRSQIETGTPYMLYKDSCNFRSNQQNLGIIKSSNLCVSGDTRILTPEGALPISQFAGRETKVWNGVEYTPVHIRQTGQNQQLLKVLFSNGNYLMCTPYHKFYITSSNKETKVDAQELKIGDKIAPFRIPVNQKTDHTVLAWVEEKGVLFENSIHLYSHDSESLRETLLDLQTVGIYSSISRVDEERYCLRLSKDSFREVLLRTHKGDLVDNLFIEAVDKTPIFGDTFCFTEPKTGKGWFEGVVTGQCTEIIEYSDNNEYACCNLSSIALPRFLKENPKKKELKRAIAYTKPDCPFCSLLALEFPGIEKRDIKEFEREWLELKEKFGLTTVPAVFIGEEYLGGFIDVWKSHLSPVFDFDELYRVVYAVTENLNKVIDLNIYPVVETEVSNKKHRPIGIGVQGLADVFGKMRLAFDEEDAKTLNREIFETLYFGALNASTDLAVRDRPYITFKGSPLSKGLFHFELQTPVARHRCPILSGKYDWEGLRQKIIQNGVRNSLLIAPMPTASTSQILGNTECFEPWTSNIFLRRTSAGEFYVCNSLLQRDLKALGLWSQQNIDKLILQQGSVAQFPIPNYLKAIYRTVWEIPQRNLLDMAVERQFFIDQSQSLNLFVTNPSLDLLTKIHFYGWKNGLKTGCYYIRSRAPVSSINFTIDPNLQQSGSSICEACSA